MGDQRGIQPARFWRPIKRRAPGETLVSRASSMGPPLRQCDGTTCGVVSVGVVMIVGLLGEGQVRPVRPWLTAGFWRCR